jgi:hypothetical protein
MTPQKRQHLLLKTSVSFIKKVRSFLPKEPDLVIMLLFNFFKFQIVLHFLQVNAWSEDYF